MEDKDRNDSANELSAEDLDMAVGGASKAELSVRAKAELSVIPTEEAEKYASKGEQHRKMGDMSREEKIKHQ